MPKGCKLSIEDTVKVYDFMKENSERLHRIGQQRVRSIILEEVGIAASVYKIAQIAKAAGVNVNSHCGRKPLEEITTPNQRTEKAISHITKELLGLLEDLGKRPSQGLVEVRERFVYRRSPDKAVSASASGWDVAGGADR